MLLITTTRNRPEAFDYLKRWVARMGHDNWEWLVVCDGGAEDYKFPRGSKYKIVRRDPTNDLLPSICENWKEALRHFEESKHDRAVVLEDDDWYSPDYLTEINRHLDKTDLVGYHNDAYYWVLSRRFQRRGNIGHASLAATAFKRAVIPCLKECCDKGDAFIDLNLWKSYKGKKLLADNFTGVVYGSKDTYKLDHDGNVIGEHPRHVGVKENWHGGEAGISDHGHTASGGYDRYGKWLTKWCGEDEAKFYLKFTHDPDRSAPFIMHNLPIQ